MALPSRAFQSRRAERADSPRSPQKRASALQMPFFVAKHYNLDISNFRFAILRSCPTALLGRAAFAAYERFAGGKTSAEGWLCHPEHLNHRRAERALGPRSPKRKTRYKRVFLFGIPRQSRYFQPLSDKFPMWDCRTYPSYNEVQDHQTFEYKAAQILWMCTDTVYREAEIDHFLLSE